MKTHVANIDNSTLVTIGSSVVGERIGGTGRSGRSALVKSTTGVTAVRTTLRRATEASTAAEATAKAATSSKSTATSHRAAEASTTSHGPTEATAAAAEARTTASKSILANFKSTALPVISVELRNGVTGIIRGLEGNDARTLGASSGVGVDVSTNDATLLGCGTEFVSIHHALRLDKK
jgi:hypothetical protein